MSPLRKANKTIVREAAIRAARSQFRKIGLTPQRQTGKKAVVVLDELFRTDPELNVSIYYEKATDSEIVLFITAWNKWRKEILREEREEISRRYADKVALEAKS